MVNTRGSANAAANANRARSTASSTSSQGQPRQAAAGGGAAAPPVGIAALDPAVRAQIEAVIAAALAAHVANSANDGSQEQPEEEPANGDEAGDAVAVAAGAVAGAKKVDKIDTRNIKVKSFDGTVPTGSFDSKARDFREELDDQIQDAQTLAGQLWSDDVKKAVLKLFLTGSALKWYRDWRTANPAATYVNSCDALVHEYRPVLLSVDVAGRIKSERKRWNETYREFADRLLQMADALEGGKTFPANARHALVAFVRSAYPKYADFLETKINLDCDGPEAELKQAVSVLSRKAESDGRLPDKTKLKSAVATAPVPKGKHKQSQRTSGPRTKSSKAPDGAKKRPAEANAAVVERKKRPKNTNISAPRSAIICWKCGGQGHTQSFHQKFSQPKATTTNASEASAHAAEEHSDQDEEMAENDDEEADE